MNMGKSQETLHKALREADCFQKAFIAMDNVTYIITSYDSNDKVCFFEEEATGHPYCDNLEDLFKHSDLQVLTLQSHY